MSAGARLRLVGAARLRLWLAPAMLATSLLPVAPAMAASNNTSQVGGTAAVAVVSPVTMINLGDMRFGNIAQPTTAGTLTLSPTGVVTTSGGVTGNQAIAQGGTGPTPGTFAITAGSNQNFIVFGPVTFNITSSGGASMPVTLLTGALQLQSNNGTTVSYLLTVGGTLSMAGNQAIGAYSGSYTLLTVYQ